MPLSVVVLLYSLNFLLKNLIVLPRIFNIIFILFQNICPGHVLTLIFSLVIMMLSTFICIYIENMRKQVDYIQANYVISNGKYFCKLHWFSPNSDIMGYFCVDLWHEITVKSISFPGYNITKCGNVQGGWIFMQVTVFI